MILHATRIAVAFACIGWKKEPLSITSRFPYRSHLVLGAAPVTGWPGPARCAVLAARVSPCSRCCGLGECRVVWSRRRRGAREKQRRRGDGAATARSHAGGSHRKSDARIPIHLGQCRRLRLPHQHRQGAEAARQLRSDPSRSDRRSAESPSRAFWVASCERISSKLWDASTLAPGLGFPPFLAMLYVSVGLRSFVCPALPGFIWNRSKRHSCLFISPCAFLPPNATLIV